MTDTDLLPCPFCGGAAKLFHDTSSDYERQWTWGVICENDDECIGGGGYFAAKDGAIAAWNRRVTVTTNNFKISSCDQLT